MSWKKLAAICAAALMMSSLAACGDEGPPFQNPTPPAGGPTPTSAESTEATSEPSPEPSVITTTKIKVVEKTVTPTPEPTDKPSNASGDKPTENVYLDVKIVVLDREQYSDGTCGDIQNVVAKAQSKNPPWDIHYVHYSSEVEPIASTTAEVNYTFTAVVTPDDFPLTTFNDGSDQFDFLSDLDGCDSIATGDPIEKLTGETGKASHRFDGLRWQDS